MKALVIYDSAYGNTEKVAYAVARALARWYETQIHETEDIWRDMVEEADLLVVGSPTQGGRPTKVMQDFLHNLPDIPGKKVAAFDTRFAEKGHGPALHWLMKIIGYAAPKITATLQQKGGTAVIEPIGFIVEEKTGPLRQGELKRARGWAMQVAAIAVLNRPAKAVL